MVCPAGTRSETKGFAGLLFNFVLALAGYSAYQTYKYCRNKKREERAAQWCVLRACAHAPRAPSAKADSPPPPPAPDAGMSPATGAQTRSPTTTYSQRRKHATTGPSPSG